MAVELKDRYDDPAKWQAMSHPVLSELKPEQIFEGEFARLYVEMQNDLWHRMIRVHGTIMILEELSDFPLEHVYDLQGMEFWRLVAANFFDAACLILHGLVIDSGKNVHSLHSFKNRIIKAKWNSKNVLDLLKETLRKQRFDSHLEDICQRVDAIRDTWIAHRLVDECNGGIKRPINGVTLEELCKLTAATHGLFGSLSFGGSFATLGGDLMPARVRGKRPRSSLGELLDLKLRNSPFINAPEQNAAWWPESREHTHPEQLAEMNRWRVHLGMEPA